MKILITGGAGYIGTELIHRLISRSEIEKIIIYDNLSRGNFNLFLGAPQLQSDKLTLIDGEILDSRKLEKHMIDCDVIIHLAAQVTTPFADVNHHLFEQVNHWGTSGVVHGIEKSNAKKFIYLSSVSVYGSGEESFDLTSTPQPQTIYGISKLRGEEQVRRISNKIPSYVLRCGNVFGYSKSMRFDAVINRFMFEGHFKGRITIQGNGKQYRSFVHISNVVNALEAILFKSVAPGTFNLVDSNRNINEITSTLQEIYPELELLFISQHLNLRQLKVNIDPEHTSILGIQEYDFAERLNTFKKHFSF